MADCCAPIKVAHRKSTTLFLSIVQALLEKEASLGKELAFMMSVIATQNDHLEKDYKTAVDCNFHQRGRYRHGDGGIYLSYDLLDLR